jgi:hypothetical protein
MGDASRAAPQRDGVSFEVERLERDGDNLVVSGHWSGLRGVRFVRPTLVDGDRAVLATLEHKPWAPSADEPWTAAFPWTGGAPDPGRLALAVAPSVTVPLDPGAAPAAYEPRAPDAGQREPQASAGTSVPTTDRMRLRLAEAELQAVTEERDRLRRELEETQRRLHETDAARTELEAGLRRERRAADAAAAQRDELVRERTAAERDRDLARDQRDEAVGDREAAVRARTRIELANEAAAQAQAAAAADVERARAERDEANAQRDEVLLAYRALQRHVQTERAELHRAESGGDPAADAAGDRPLGVRKMPAARTVMAELQRRAPAPRLVVSRFDIWVFRVLGSVAAACFILLLVSILRVFI